MRRKSILEEVEEQEKRRKESEKMDRVISLISKIIGFIAAICVVIGAYFLFKPSEITEEERMSKIEAQKAQAVINRLTTTCETEIKNSLNFPSTYRRHLIPTIDTHNNITKIMIAFTAKNALGAELPQLGTCHYQDGFLKLENIRNR